MKPVSKIILAVLVLLKISVNAQQQQQQQGPPPGPPPEARLKQVITHLEKELFLKADQKQKVKQAYQMFFAGIEKLRSVQPEPPQPGMPPGKKEDVDKLVKTRDDSIKKILTAAQFKKYQEIEKTMRPGGRHPGGPPPPPPPGAHQL